MRKAKLLTIILGTVVISFLLYAWMKPHEVAVEITREDFRNKYIEVLKKQEIPFSLETDHLKRNWIVIKGYSHKELKEKTAEYESWESEILKTEGVKVLGE